MNGKTLLASMVAVIVVASSAALLLLDGGNGPSGPVRTVSATVHFDDGSGDVFSAEGTGRDLISLVKDAAGDVDVEFDPNGTVRSVGGRTAPEGHRWVVFKWASPAGWSPYRGTDVKGIPQDANLAVAVSKVTVNDGKVTYGQPEVEVRYTLHFFIQLREHYNANDWIQMAMGTENDRREGAWFTGTGGSVMEAFEEVVWGQIFTGTYSDMEREEILSYRTVENQLGWLDMFMGWEDTQVDSEGEYGTWTYWSQYNWTEDVGWEYNNLSLGRYDITVHRHFALILQTTYAQDTGGHFPVTDIPSGPA